MPTRKQRVFHNIPIGSRWQWCGISRRGIQIVAHLGVINKHLWVFFESGGAIPVRYFLEGWNRIDQEETSTSSCTSD